MVNHKNYLFILSNQGAGGHQLGRMISELDCVYWYSCSKNGFTPNDVFLNPDSAVGPERVTGKDISGYHYDRIVDNNVVPLVGERIEVYWNQTDIDFYYNNVWTSQIKKFSTILKNQYLHWILHDTPGPLINRFINAKIISLIDIDVESVISRYLETTARFPAFYRMTNLRPNYKTRHALDIENLEKRKPGSTLQDLWQYQHPGGNYKEYVRSKLIKDNSERLLFEHPRYLKVTWEDFSLDKVKSFLNCA